MDTIHLPFKFYITYKIVLSSEFEIIIFNLNFYQLRSVSAEQTTIYTNNDSALFFNFSSRLKLTSINLFLKINQTRQGLERPPVYLD